MVKKQEEEEEVKNRGKMRRRRGRRGRRRSKRRRRKRRLKKKKEKEEEKKKKQEGKKKEEEKKKKKEVEEEEREGGEKKEKEEEEKNSTFRRLQLWMNKQHIKKSELEDLKVTLSWEQQLGSKRDKENTALAPGMDKGVSRQDDLLIGLLLGLAKVAINRSRLWEVKEKIIKVVLGLKGLKLGMLASGRERSSQGYLPSFQLRFPTPLPPLPNRRSLGLIPGLMINVKCMAMIDNSPNFGTRPHML
eukprot:g45866.t1